MKRAAMEEGDEREGLSVRVHLLTFLEANHIILISDNGSRY